MVHKHRGVDLYTYTWMYNYMDILKLFTHVYRGYILKEVWVIISAILKLVLHFFIFFYKIHITSIIVRNDIKSQVLFPLAIYLQWFLISNLIVNSKLKKVLSFGASTNGNENFMFVLGRWKHFDLLSSIVRH